MWVLGDSRNGLFSEIEVHTGKEGSGETGLGGRVVTTLTRNLVGKYHHVYFDNLFTSSRLLEDLLKDGMYACGTARINRKGFPACRAKEDKIDKQVKTNDTCKSVSHTHTHTHTHRGDSVTMQKG